MIGHGKGKVRIKNTKIKDALVSPVEFRSLAV